MKSLEALFGPNAALVEELYKQYQEEPESVPEHWKKYFDELSTEDGSDTKKVPTPKSVKQAEPQVSEKKAERVAAPKKESKAEPSQPKGVKLEKLIGVTSKIAANMDASLEVPTATSVRVIPVKMLVEDRNIINRHLAQRGDPKATFTHFIGWAVIRAMKEIPAMNAYYYKEGDQPYRAVPDAINLGIAIDLPGKDGSRNLVVANIKGVDSMNFNEFLHAYHALINKARSGKLEVSDFEGTTVSITNPGTIGTVSSLPRLMKNQGLIVATGAMDYPAEFQAMSPDLLNHLGISKVMTVSSTYDHRIIQGAESGMFLSTVHKMLIGQSDFYESIFSDLSIPYDPIPYGTDNYTGFMNGGGSNSLAVTKKAISVMNLINMYRTHGHVLANINPLKHGPGHHPELEYEYHGLTMWDMDREFYCGGLGGHEQAPLRDIVMLLRDTYCGTIGSEFMHIMSLTERNWLSDTMESTLNQPKLSKKNKKMILHKLNQASAFEEFLHKKYVGHKRFSLEGAESLIPVLSHMLDSAGSYGVEEVVFGMAHRGRLNVLVNIMGKSYKQIFSEFEGNIDPDSSQGSGDVKYHLGTRGEFETENGKKIRLQLMPNPSHLESVNPVVEGAVRSKQDVMDDEHTGQKIIPLLIHGDAAFAGQGVVAETLTMSQLDGYKTGGTIHVIINNQIGFTTLPKDGRSTRYASDLAKMILAPIFHVNGDDPEACVHAIELALEYRQKFGKDVVIDLICYRKHGHNEGDEPAFTQPGLYREIKNHASVREIYSNTLIRKGDLSEEEIDELFKEFDQLLEAAFDEAKNIPKYEISDEKINRKSTSQSERETAIATDWDFEKFNELAFKLNKVPGDFDTNPKLLRILAKRSEIVEKNQKKIEWGYAEALAFATLLEEGIDIRLSGQDCERGTFSHRHSVLHGTTTDQKFTPLNNLSDSQAVFEVYNSLLSEFAALGFEFGYSASNLNKLVIWEAQFGDFANGAQIIIDQYLAASEAKWGQRSNLMMLLPHGYEGQGPEHSSGRMERFLQLCAEDNMRVANCSTPAQFFHLIRRQALSEVKKPTIVFTPKSLLRHPLAVANTEELANGRFNYIIPDETVKPSDSVRKIVFCSGKVYYDLLIARNEQEIDDIALIRLEQIYPFPDSDISDLLKEYKNVKDIVWCQEEPRNMGAWTFVRPRFEHELHKGQKLNYVGRDSSASPAAGSLKLHNAEQDRLVKTALS